MTEQPRRSFTPPWEIEDNGVCFIIDAVVVLSAVAVVVADNTYTPEQRPYAIGLAVVLGAIPLGIGRALRYILAGT